MPCEDCGTSVARDERDLHTCDAEQRLDYELFQLREEVAALEAKVWAYLRSAHGRFDAWYAERQRPPLQES